MRKKKEDRSELEMLFDELSAWECVGVLAYLVGYFDNDEVVSEVMRSRMKNAIDNRAEK